jgi:hypothetical protein
VAVAGGRIPRAGGLAFDRQGTRLSGLLGVDRGQMRETRRQTCIAAVVARQRKRCAGGDLNGWTVLWFVGSESGSRKDG